MSKYIFEGETIKLIPKHYYKMRELYPYLDLVKELEQLDFELMDKKKYWCELNAKLNYRNSVAKQKQQKNYNKSMESLIAERNDTSWAKQ